MKASYLIDTDVCIDALRPRTSASLMDQVRSIASDGAAISVITYGEVYEGILFSRQRAQNLQRWREFIAPLDVIGVTAGIAEVWAEIRGTLRRRALTTPDNDLLIAATALHFDMAVLTRNVRHFARVDGLRVVALAADPG
ncbi:MAG: type II toxin-antitoxin system VapC family toxin [Chloroflexota bacterium]|nr:type II toxin-antitoxin system VapC family toxin [Chloroflexota bacterium]